MRAPLSVVVPTRDRPHQLRRCLAALASTVAAPDEIVVVDSASRDPEPVAAAVADLSGSPAPVRLVRLPRPGASLARNAGWRAARHDLIAFVDDDTEVLPGWVDAMVAALQRPGAEFVTGWIGVPEHQAGVASPNPVMLVDEPFTIDRDWPGPLGASANLGVRRGTLASAGGFDERLGPGTRLRAGEDQELIDRWVIAGRTGHYRPEVRVVHDQWRTRAEKIRLEWSYGIGLGARLARLARSDRQRARAVQRLVIVDDGVMAFRRALADGYQTGALMVALRLLGLAWGRVLAIPARR